jgi:hypothetical protein
MCLSQLGFGNDLVAKQANLGGAKADAFVGAQRHALLTTRLGGAIRPVKNEFQWKKNALDDDVTFENSTELE